MRVWAVCVVPFDRPGCHVASFTTLDLSAHYGGFGNRQVFGSIINVFNRMAPFAPGAVGGGVNDIYNWAFSGASGTQFNVGVVHVPATPAGDRRPTRQSSVRCRFAASRTASATTDASNVTNIASRRTASASR